MKINCKKCGKPVSKNNKSGFCKKCYDWSGVNNPFFGKKHSQKAINIIKEKAALASTEKWKDPEYRERVIRGVSKPRKKEFGEQQSERVKQWYIDNPKQRNIRAGSMRRSWEDGKIQPSVHSVSESKKEIKIREEISKALPDSKVEKKTVRIDRKWYRPDVLIDDWIVVEFFGDYWHANPKKYSKDDIVHHGLKASEIWEKDRLRLEELEKRYSVLVVWEKRYDRGGFDLDSLVEQVLLAMDDG